jgi:hypothetical protein
MRSSPMSTAACPGIEIHNNQVIAVTQHRLVGTVSPECSCGQSAFAHYFASRRAALAQAFRFIGPNYPCHQLRSCRPATFAPLEHCVIEGAKWNESRAPEALRCRYSLTGCCS